MGHITHINLLKGDRYMVEQLKALWAKNLVLYPMTSMVTVPIGVVRVNNAIRDNGTVGSVVKAVAISGADVATHGLVTIGSGIMTVIRARKAAAVAAPAAQAAVPAAEAKPEQHLESPDSKKIDGKSADQLEHPSKK
jgi:hypothetical protein